jgi:MFS family permease
MAAPESAAFGGIMQPQTTEAPAYPGFGTKAYRAYVLGALLLVYTFNFIDRILISIIQEPIRREFGLQDWQLGVLGGTAFAVLYSLLGVPIARFAERANRISIIAIGFALWSGMTALCGLAGSYLQLLLARVGVGIGEAACSPPSHSAISDYFPANRRASALAIYALGIPLGSMLAALGGGWLAQNYDWRTAFLLLGAPGVALAIVLRLTVREPPRAGADTAAPGLVETLRSLSGKSSFWFVAFGGALVSFVGYGTAQFMNSYLIRTFELSVYQASLLFGLIAGVSTTAGTFLGGFLTDRLEPRRPNVHAWLPAVGLVIAAPLYLLALNQTNLALAIAPILAAPVFHYLYLGPMFAVTQGVAQPRMRATAAAVLLLVVNLIGYGLGPPFVGALADAFANIELADAHLTVAGCAAVEARACAAARALGLKYAMMVDVCVLLAAAALFLMAARTWLRDRVG